MRSLRREIGSGTGLARRTPGGLQRHPGVNMSTVPQANMRRIERSSGRIGRHAGVCTTANSR